MYVVIAALYGVESEFACCVAGDGAGLRGIGIGERECCAGKGRTGVIGDSSSDTASVALGPKAGAREQGDGNGENQGQKVGESIKAASWGIRVSAGFSTFCVHLVLPPKAVPCSLGAS